MKGWACCVLIFHQQKRTFGGWRTNSRDFSPLLSSENCKTLSTKTHTACIYGGDCDAAIAKAAAAVTHAQSQSQEVGSGDEGLGLCFDLPSTETDFLVAGGRAVETLPFFLFRMTFHVYRGSGQARMYPRRRWLSLSSRAKAFTLKGRHRRFVGDSAFHTSLQGAPLLANSRRGITRFCKKYRI